MEENISNKHEFIVIFQIGPVQEFISEARKTADFWAGSYLLSYLMNQAIVIAQNNGIEIIYPTIINNPTGYSSTNLSIDSLNIDSLNIPNRFVGLYKGDDVKEKLRFVEEDTRNILKNISERILNKLIDKSLIDKIYKQQIENSFVIYWIAFPIENENEFGKKYKEAEIIFDSRKSVRDFKQIEREKGFKCTVCGKRIPVLPDSKYALNRSDIRNFWNNLKRNYGFLIQENEALCSVCALKRFLSLEIPEIKQVYPSTASIAQASFLERLLKNVDKNKLEPFLNKLGEINPDYLQIGATVPRITEMFENNFPKFKRLDSSIFYIEEYSKLPEQERKEIEIDLDYFYSVAGNPHKYYAVIQFDGDRVGKYLRTLQTKEDLANFSKKIFNFSNTIKREGEKNFNIKVVYAGGDEGVVFSPLQNIFNFIWFIHDKFINIVGVDKTISLGIAISHWSDPLIDAIKASRISLKNAKDEGRNRCGITVIKRSGDRLNTVLKFDKLNSSNKTVFNLIDKLLLLYSNNQISTKWYGDMIIRKNAFLDTTKDTKEVISIDYEILIAESKRLLARKLSKSVDEFNKKEILKLLQDIISNLGNTEKHLDDFFDMLEIVEFVSKER